MRMGNVRQRPSRRVLVLLGTVALLVVCILVALPLSDSFRCTGREKAVLGAIPHHPTAQRKPDLKSIPFFSDIAAMPAYASGQPVQGWCSDAYSGIAGPEMVLEYYRKQLKSQGWTEVTGPGREVRARRAGFYYAVGVYTDPYGTGVSIRGGPEK